MKKLREMIFGDSLSEERKEHDDDFEMAMTVILNENFWCMRLTS
jgi:hypothetical protein